MLGTGVLCLAQGQTAQPLTVDEAVLIVHGKSGKAE